MNPWTVHVSGLKKLTLVIQTAHFEGLTDAVFSLIFRHMKLEQLYLTSGGLMTTVAYVSKCHVDLILTDAAIRALLNPDFPFLTAIQMFPFEDWTVTGISREEFEDLMKQFPCYQF